VTAVKDAVAAVDRVDRADGAATVDFAVTGGTAERGDDFTLSDGTLAFADSERVGVRYLGPANELLLRVVAARWLGLEPEAGALLALTTATISLLGWEREQAVVRRWNLEH